MNKKEYDDLLKNLQKLPKKRQLEIYFNFKIKCNYYKDTLTIEQFREKLELIPTKLHEQMFIFRLTEKYDIFSAERVPIKFYFEKLKDIHNRLDK